MSSPVKSTFRRSYTSALSTTNSISLSEAVNRNGSPFATVSKLSSVSSKLMQASFRGIVPGWGGAQQAVDRLSPLLDENIDADADETWLKYIPALKSGHQSTVSVHFACRRASAMLSCEIGRAH